LKLSENFEVFSWRCTFPLKIFRVHLRLAPFFLTYTLQRLCLANFSLFMLSHFLWRDYVRRLAPFLSYICAFEVKTFLRIALHFLYIIFYISFFHINFKGNVLRYSTNSVLWSWIVIRYTKYNGNNVNYDS